MKDLLTICPVCEKDIIITGREVMLAVRHKTSAGGQALVGCPVCFRALVLPSDVPEDDIALEEWLGDIDDIQCVPLLNDEDVKLPAGKFNNLGKVVYRPGGGGPALMKRPYMFKYGIDPEKAWAAMDQGGKPFVIGGTNQ
jgi:hypothetical protein